MTTQQILNKISVLQDVQRNSPPTSREWQEASRILQPLFAEMARRSAR